ncbi:hypothetical protein EW145_g4426 [Phellinidium pouzarii]|uniref:Chitin-binding type-4 domain-containing protein n=1 Tax=Phellinidium pouzarii TaxID=167371 RepID=A0A4S4L8F6_9AGAM|nr:hypothetical protein EW145_g4426 [Phellinidium pouzarii]
MHFTSTTAFAVVAFAASAAAHGNIESPTARGVGSAMTSVCGGTIEGMLGSDIYMNQQQLEMNSHNSEFTDECLLFQCKGTQLADNTANVHAFTQGQTIPITVFIQAPHTGVANVSVIDLKSNTVIGEPLISWTDYASTSHTIPANNTQFSVTLPTNLGSTCSTAGNCALQWWWDARPIDQTYMSCIDFTA